MLPWTIDAKDLDISSIEKFKGTIFHSSNITRRFVSNNSSPEILISGPKGVGKTLLLKLKRSEQTGKGIKLLPENTLVDKFIGTPHIFSYKKSQDLLTSEDYWKNIWLLSLITVFLKSDKEFDFEDYINDSKSEFVSDILDSNTITSSCDAFARYLAMPHQQYYQAYEDLNSCLIPYFRRIHTPMMTFIDNVDEYFNLNTSSNATATMKGDFKHLLWANAQKGLAKAARELNSLNNHIKVFATIRQEVMQIFGASDPMALQLSGNTLELKYSSEDLKEVLIKNILAEEDSNLASPYADNPIDKFFGVENTIIEHLYTNEDEYVVDFIIRHTLLRPRDIALLGGKISELPSNRRSSENIRDTINSTSKYLIQSYLTSAQVTITDMNEDILFRMFSGNILSKEDLANLSKKYDKIMFAVDGEELERHVFCDLYRLGLLGFVDESNKSTGSVQRFAPVGTIPLTPKTCLPDANTYLLHPSMYDLIASYNPKFFNGMDSLNIVGNLRPWREHEDIHFVVKADIVKYSEIMLDPDFNDSFPDHFSKIVESNSRGLLYTKIEGGDGLLLIDRNWKRVVLAFNQIQEKLKASVYQRSLRAGGDAGIIRYDLHGDNVQHLRGGALRYAARIEPISVTGQLTVTEQFKDRAMNRDPNAKFKQLSPQDLPKARAVGGQFDISKNAEDATQIQSLYMVII